MSSRDGAHLWPPMSGDFAERIANLGDVLGRGLRFRATVPNISLRPRKQGVRPMTIIEGRQSPFLVSLAINYRRFED